MVVVVVDVVVVGVGVVDVVVVDVVGVGVVVVGLVVVGTAGQATTVRTISLELSVSVIRAVSLENHAAALEYQCLLRLVGSSDSVESALL